MVYDSKDGVTIVLFGKTAKKLEAPASSMASPLKKKHDPKSQSKKTKNKIESVGSVFRPICKEERQKAVVQI
jgi:hypothetical protein